MIYTQKYGVTIVNYIDDLIGISPVHDANRAFKLTLHVLQEIRLVKAADKAVPSSVECVCLGIIINTQNFNLCIPAEKLKAVISICYKFMKYTKISKLQI
jgi:hypothetical protein